MKYKRRMSRNDFSRLMRTVALRYDLKCVTDRKLRELWKSGDTVMTANSFGIMWISRDYLAYVLGRAVRYVYVTQSHINEEKCAYANASKARKKNIFLPLDVLQCFDAAERRMNEQDLKFWVDTQYLA